MEEMTRDQTLLRQVDGKGNWTLEILLRTRDEFRNSVKRSFSMRRLVENKFMFAAVFVLFALACATSAIHGARVPALSHKLLAEPANVAHGSTMPPDPWDGQVTVAHGPIMPPDPWDGNLSVTA